MGHQFIRFFGCSIKCEGMVHIVTLRKRHRFIRTVNRTGRSKNQMSGLIVTTGFQDIQKSMKITFKVSVRVSQRITDSGLGSQVYYGEEWMSLKNTIDAFFIRQIKLLKTKIGAIS